jgi:hypothetical protein
MSTNTTATAAATAAEQIPTPVPTLRTHLAPPFGAGWTRVIAPVPKGYTASATLYDNDGRGELTLNAKPHPPDAKTTIGWYWAGWQRRVSVQLATVFIVEITDVDVDFRGGGVWKPRCFVTLRPVGGGEDLYDEVLLGEGGDAFVAVCAPQSPILPASVQYDLKVNFNVRAVYSGDQNPRGTLRARIRSVRKVFAFPTLAEGAAERTAGGDDALDPKELGAALADLDRNAEVSEIGAGG